MMLINGWYINLALDWFLGVFDNNFRPDGFGRFIMLKLLLLFIVNLTP